jgi:hypothetical protein
MFCQCGGTGKGIKSKVGGELDISLQALFTYLCDLCAFECAISPLILLFFNMDKYKILLKNKARMSIFLCWLLTMLIVRLALKIDVL